MKYAKNSVQLDSDKLPLEAALDKVGFGLYGFLMTCLTSAILVAFTCIAYGSPFIVPTSACELKTTSGQQGILASGTIISLLVGGVIWSYLADTRGRRSMLLISLTGAAALNVIATISVNWIMLLVFQLLAGLFSAGVYSVSMTLLSESIPMAYRNTAVLIVSSVMILAQGFMASLMRITTRLRSLLEQELLDSLSTESYPIKDVENSFRVEDDRVINCLAESTHLLIKMLIVIAIPIIPLKFSYYIPSLGIYWNSWRTLMLVYSIPAILCAICLFFMQESPKFIFSKKDEIKALEALKAIYRTNNWMSKVELQLKGIIKDDSVESDNKYAIKDQILPLLKAPLLKYTIIMLCMNICQQLTGFVVWMPTIADQFVRIMQAGGNTDLTVCDILNVDRTPSNPDETPCALDETSLLILLGLGASQSVFNLIISFLINYVGRRNISIMVIILCGGSGILVNVVPNVFASALFFCIMFLGTVVIGLCTAICVALFPTNLRAMAIAFTMVAQYIGIVASIQILNWLLKFNCAAGFYLFGSLFLSAAVAAFFLPDDRKLRTTEAIQAKVVNSE